MIDTEKIVRWSIKITRAALVGDLPPSNRSAVC